MRLLLLPAACIALTACVAMNEMPEPREGARLFADNCTACHDYRGTGGGVLIGGQVPPDLTQIALRNDGVFPRAEVLSVIDGYGKGEHTGRVMPEFGAILEGDTVPVEIDGRMTPVPRPLAALLEYLEDIQVDG
ncbi:cytochrome C [Thalassococcus sp. S3]|nr:c-type cytochrome [Thalassococcus sp. S3]QBF32829.1 cytochrome C [Thalassococcus sp. S3]